MHGTAASLNLMVSCAFVLYRELGLTLRLQVDFESEFVILVRCVFSFVIIHCWLLMALSSTYTHCIYWMSMLTLVQLHLMRRLEFVRYVFDSVIINIPSLVVLLFIVYTLNKQWMYADGLQLQYQADRPGQPNVNRKLLSPNLVRWLRFCRQLSLVVLTY